MISGNDQPMTADPWWWRRRRLIATGITAAVIGVILISPKPHGDDALGASILRIFAICGAFLLLEVLIPLEIIRSRYARVPGEAVLKALVRTIFVVLFTVASVFFLGFTCWSIVRRY